MAAIYHFNFHCLRVWRGSSGPRKQGDDATVATRAPGGPGGEKTLMLFECEITKPCKWSEYSG